MNITTIEPTKGKPYITRAGIKEQLDMSISSVNTRIKEIRQEIEKGRYPEIAIIKDGGFTLVNYLVFIDYESNRQKLKESNLRKYVEPFDAYKIAKSIGWYN